MDSILLKARAKINLALDIKRKRPDGYHEIQTIMQTVNLYDQIFIKKIPKPQIKLVTNLDWLPTDHRNLVYKAAEYLFNRFHIQNGIFIKLTKNIPVSAGLGGGSADCAATLVGIRRLFNLPLTNGELLKEGTAFGADVPFCLMRGTALAEGVGEILTPLPPHPFVYVLLVKPSVSVSTASVFKEFDFNAVSSHPNIQKLIQGIQHSSLREISAQMVNVLETVTIKKHPIIDEIKGLMLENRALCAMMSGSGATVFGYFRSKRDALSAKKRIAEKLLISDLYVTTIFNKRTGGN